MLTAPTAPSIYSSLAFSATVVTNNVVTENFEIGSITLSSVNVTRIDNGMMVITGGNITSSASFNEVVIDKHASRHNFNGADPLTPGLDADITTLTDSVGSSGSSEKIPRADHVHYHGQRLGGNLHSLASHTSAGFMASLDKNKLDFFINPSDVVPSSVGITSPGVLTNYSRSDHAHYHGIQSTGSDHEVATATTNGFLSASDKTIFNNLSIGTDVITFNGIYTVNNPVLCFSSGINSVNIPANTDFQLIGAYYTTTQSNGIVQYNDGYTLPLAGCYRIQLGVSVEYPIDQTVYTISVLVNTSPTEGLVITGNSGIGIITDSILFDNNYGANDVISVVVNHNGGNEVFTSGITNSKLSIIKLS